MTFFYFFVFFSYFQNEVAEIRGGKIGYVVFADASVRRFSGPPPHPKIPSAATGRAYVQVSGVLADGRPEG